MLADRITHADTLATDLSGRIPYGGMLNRDLLKILNGGDAVAFVGSGVSVDAGVASWDGLLHQVVARLKTTHEALPSLSGKPLPKAFDLLRHAVSADQLEMHVRAIICQIKTPGRYHNIVADWPFSLYVTTNYDHLLEKALERENFLSVGAEIEELRKLSGGSKQLVWHPHGSVELDPKRAGRLILSETDYAALYAAGGPVASILHDIVRDRRVVFFGFGFGDYDLLHILKSAGRLSDSSRPSFAFIAEDPDDPDRHAERERFRDEYNVEVIPYPSKANNHSALSRILETYGSFIRRRSSARAPHWTGTPDYHPVVTSLQVFNRIADSSGAADARSRLCKAALLSGLREQPIGTVTLQNTVPFNKFPPEHLSATLRALSDQKLLIDNKGMWELTAAARDICDKAEGNAKIEKDMFTESVRQRLLALTPPLPSLDHALTISVEFMEGACRQRGLGIAQNLVSENASEADLRAVSIMQPLSQGLGSCSPEEAAAVVEVVAGVIASPQQAEAQYLGTLTQAYFAQIIIGASEDVRRISREHLRQSCFFLDAHFMLSLLAVGSRGHGAAVGLVRALSSLGAKLATTELLVQEVREHAQWIRARLDEDGEDGLVGIASGQHGSYSNVFLEGYILSNDGPDNFRGYLQKVVGSPITDQRVADTLAEKGIVVAGPGRWRTSGRELEAEIRNAQEEISRRRIERSTFTHSRQTRAEAETAVLVTKIRNKKVALGAESFADAYFVSPSRVIEGVPGMARSIVLLPTGLGRWLDASTPFSPADAKALFDSLLWELSLTGIAFVPREQILRRFSGVVQASGEELEFVFSTYRGLMVQEYGPAADHVFSEIDPLEKPFFAKRVTAKAMQYMQRRVEEAERRAVDAERGAKLGGKEKEELERLRARTRLRHERQKSIERGIRSNPGKKKH